MEKSPAKSTHRKGTFQCASDTGYRSSAVAAALALDRLREQLILDDALRHGHDGWSGCGRPLPCCRPRIKSAGEIQVGVDATYAPNEYKDSSGNAIGWDIDLFNAVAKKLGVKAVLQHRGLRHHIIPKITGGKYDVGVSSFTDTTDRQKQVNFVDYYSAGILWASPSGKTVDPDNACGLKVAVETGTVEETDDVPGSPRRASPRAKPAIQILKFDGQDQATNAVVLGQAGRHERGPRPSPTTRSPSRRASCRSRASRSTSRPTASRWARARSSHHAIQKALQKLVDDGSYNRDSEEVGRRRPARSRRSR